MDGLLIDSERLSHESWLQASDTLGVAIEDSVFHGIIGLNKKTFRGVLHERIGHRVDVEELIRVADDFYRVKVNAGVPLKKGARACIEWLSNNDMPQSVATSSKQKLARKKLGHHDLLDHFISIASGDQVNQGKPHPEIFLTAASRMSIAPEDCLMFEDSKHGVVAASEAGGRVILVPDLAVHGEGSHKRVFQIWDSLEQGPRQFQEWIGRC